MPDTMRFFTRKWVKPEDLNPNETLFGGSLLRWIDEEATIFTISLLDSKRVVTKFISEINFVSSAKQGDIIEIGIALVLPFFDVKDSSPMLIVLLNKLIFLYLRFTISLRRHPVYHPKRNIFDSS